MRFFLSIVGSLLWALAVLIFFAASSAFQEGVAGAFLTAGSILIAGACIVCAVEDGPEKERFRRELVARRQAAATAAASK